MALDARPYPTLGILGGGQLGRMTALAAIRMGIGVRFLIPTPSGCVDGLGEVVVGDWEDPAVLRPFVAACDAVTVESEWAPAEAVAAVLGDQARLWPAPSTLQAIRHKGRQNDVLAEAGLPLPAYARCAGLGEARAAAERFGYPVVVKRYEGSYDGYGNATVRSADELPAAWDDLAADDGALVEAWAPFERELAVLVARRADGAHVVYPVAHTEQRDHRCHAVVVPAPGLAPDVARRAQEIGLAAVEAVGGVGLTAVELFELPDGEILVNELAPRPHNTGHYSIEGCHTSQFENHLRGVLGLPLGDPGLRAPCAVMINILGHRDGEPQRTGLEAALSVPGAAVHIYGKESVRPARKMGHVTVTGDDPDDVRRRAERAAAAIRL